MKRYLAYIAFTALIGILLLLNWLGIFRTFYGIDTAILITLVGGYKIIYNAISSLLERKFSADIALVIAAGAALYVGEYRAAAEAMFIMLIGEGLEEFAAHRTHTAIEKLIRLVPQTARVFRDGREQEVDVQTVAINDIVLVWPGAQIPVDGVVVAGRSSVDQSTITGESLPAEKEVGHEVFSGTINGLGPLEIKATRVGRDTTLSKVIQLMEEAQEKKAPIQRTADRYARYFLPLVLLAAGATFFFTGDWMRVVSVLIVACPCALILATPAAVVAAIGRLAREGILVKGGNHVEQMAHVDCFVFDKTGTLTRGKPVLASVVPLNSCSAQDVLSLAARVEQRSEHLLAQLIVKEAEARGVDVAHYKSEITGFAVHMGLGVEAYHNANRILVGSPSLMREKGVSIDPTVDETLAKMDAEGQTAVLVSDNGCVVGAIGIHDTLRPEARAVINKLNELGIETVYVLTGDREPVARAIAREAGIEEVAWQLLPEQKVERIRQIQREGMKVAMVGDGINDAPSMATADVGIAMGATGTDITAQAADIVLMTDSLEKLPFLVSFCRRTVTTIRQNILWFAFVVNTAAVGAASSGLIGPVASAVLHQTASLLVILNSLRLLVRGKFRETRIGRELLQATHVVQPTLEKIKAYDANTIYEWAIAHRKAAVGSLIGVLALAYLLSGVYTVQPDEIGVLQRFGRKLEPFAYPGLHYHWPWPVERITKTKAERVRAVEIGFRTSNRETREPEAYEWNIQHRFGRYEKQPDEALILVGDENMIEANIIVQYAVYAPDRYLFRLENPEKTVRAVSEHVIRYLAAHEKLDALLTVGRAEIENQAEKEIQRKLDDYGSGIRIMGVKLQDVHPSLEVVDAFRDVSSAFEEKNKLINLAEAYHKEQVLLARGQAQARLEAARAYHLSRTNRAEGDADRFTQAESAYRSAPGVTQTRLYLEAIEQALPGKSKFIVDSHKLGKRQIFFMDALGLKLNSPAAEEKKRKRDE